PSRFALSKTLRSNRCTLYMAVFMQTPYKVEIRNSADRRASIGLHSCLHESAPLDDNSIGGRRSRKLGYRTALRTNTCARASSSQRLWRLPLLARGAHVSS